MDNIAWIAGLLEGEGCFTLTKGTISVQLNMTDEDIVRRAADIAGAPSIGINNKRQIKNGKHKPCFRWSVCGQNAVPLLNAILPYMGERRTKRINELLAIQATKRPYRREITACPHTDRKHQGRGMCRACYQHDWYMRERSSERGDTSVYSVV